jgi:hypothetical protein
MKATENQLFGSFAGSDLQAISIERFCEFRPRRHRRPDHPDDLLGWFADTIKRTKNVIGFHGVISTLLPDPENPAVDQAIQNFNPRLKKVVACAPNKFNLLNLCYTPGFRKDECQDIKLDLFDKNYSQTGIPLPDIHLSKKVTIMCRNDELSCLFTNRFRPTRYMKLKRI